MIKARELLAALLVFIAAGDSFWYTINGDTTTEYALCRRLGFFSEVDYYALLIAAGLAGYAVTPGHEKKQLKINPKEWVEFIQTEEYGLSSETAEHIKKKFDIDALVAGKNQSTSNRCNFHLIRLGDKDSKSYEKNMSKQKQNGKLITSPPALPALRARQRTLSRSTQDIIADVIVHNEDVFYDAIRLGRTFTKTTSTPKPKPVREHPSSQTATPSPPTKKQRSVQQCSTPSNTMPSPEPVLESSVGIGERMITQTPEPVVAPVVAPVVTLRKDCDLVQIALGHATGDTQIDVESAEASAALDRLLTQCIALKQKISGDKIVLNYNDHRNRKDATFVRVPRNQSEQTALRQNKFWSRVHTVHGMGDAPKSAKRAAKHFKNQYEDAFNDFLHEEGIATRHMMEAHKVAAMFKAGGVTAKKSRRALLRVLRHHFGKHAFAPEHQVHMLCDGHTKVEVNKIEYQYEEGEAPETLDFHQKHIAKETEAQLRVSELAIIL